MFFFAFLFINCLFYPKPYLFLAFNAYLLQLHFGKRRNVRAENICFTSSFFPLFFNFFYRTFLFFNYILWLKCCKNIIKSHESMSSFVSVSHTHTLMYSLHLHIHLHIMNNQRSTGCRTQSSGVHASVKKESVACHISYTHRATTTTTACHIVNSTRLELNRRNE